MSRTPVCPVCKSTAVTSDPSNGGAGRCVCRCGHRAPVRDFYPDPVHGELVMNHQQSEDGQSVIIRATMFVDPRRINYVPPPSAPIKAEIDTMIAAKLQVHGYGKINNMRHNREPAPIRQYKDDD